MHYYYLKIYLFWQCWILVMAHEIFPASCRIFCYDSRILYLQPMSSLVVVCRLQSSQPQQLQLTGLVALRHVGSQFQVRDGTHISRITKGLSDKSFIFLNTFIVVYLYTVNCIFKVYNMTKHNHNCLFNLFKKIGAIKGIFHKRMGTVKDNT